MLSIPFSKLFAQGLPRAVFFFGCLILAALRVEAHRLKGGSAGGNGGWRSLSTPHFRDFYFAILSQPASHFTQRRAACVATGSSEAYKRLAGTWGSGSDSIVIQRTPTAFKR